MAAPADDTRTVRVQIQGRVQGVGFRYWTEATATRLGLSGWVRNRRDGSVEAVLSGPADAVAEMLDLCRQGPTSSRVDHIDIAKDDDPPPTGFDVMPSV
jgi:acylphosphatase